MDQAARQTLHQLQVNRVRPVTGVLLSLHDPPDSAPLTMDDLRLSLYVNSPLRRAGEQAEDGPVPLGRIIIACGRTPSYEYPSPPTRVMTYLYPLSGSDDEAQFLDSDEPVVQRTGVLATDAAHDATLILAAAARRHVAADLRPPLPAEMGLGLECPSNPSGNSA